jgi:hypothetical protein
MAIFQLSASFFFRFLTIKPAHFMKRTLASALFILVLCACQDSTSKLLKAIDGRWQIKTATYSGGTGRDSVATFSTASFNFDHCSSSANGSGPANCQMDFTNDTNQLFGFTYQAPNQGQSLYISPTGETKAPNYQAVASQIAGSYEVLTLTDNLLVMRRSLQSTGSAYQSVQFSASK